MTSSSDESWYSRQSGRKALSPHCPLAANDKCPRYFLSQRHAAAAGATTLQLSDDERSRLDEKWAASDVVTSMDLTVGSSLTADQELHGVDGFCPEVSARIFGLYCSSLRKFPNEDARLAYHKILAAENVPKADPRWDWMIVEPRHYTECHEFSVYALNTVAGIRKPKNRRGSISPRLRFQVFSRDGYRCAYCGVTGKDSALHVDHKISVADGGTDETENLVTACEQCNLGKGAKSIGNG